MTLLHLLCVTILLTVTLIHCYTVDDSRGVGPQFDGIGGLSAGVCTTTLYCINMLHHSLYTHIGFIKIVTLL